MPTLATVTQLISAYGLWLLLPFSVAEGPIITVIASYLAHQGLMPIVGVYIVCIAGDLIGDTLWYGLGRFAPDILPLRWQERFGITQGRKLALEDHFAQHGGRTLLFGKLTHSAGMPIMVASGLAKMPYGPYIWYNLLGTLPKTLLFCVIGYFLGAAYSSINVYMGRVSLALLVVIGIAVAVYFQRRWRKE